MTELITEDPEKKEKKGVVMDLIADSVTFAQALSVNMHWKGLKLPNSTDKVMEEATEGKCETASLNAAYYLLKKDSAKSISKYILLKSHIKKKEKKY